MNTENQAYRGAIFYFRDSATFENVPRLKHQSSSHYVYIEDGMLIVNEGKIVAVGPTTNVRRKYNVKDYIDYSNKLITPGFIDTHLHATQTSIVAAYGKKLLEWLQNYVFPAERVYDDHEKAREDINIFIDLLIQNGTTTACAYGPLFFNSANLLFEELARRNLRFITGNTMMDAHSPEYLSFSAKENHDNATKLIRKWHNHKRLKFALTPRFALSTSEELLEMTGDLHELHPDTYIQTHLSENIAEIEQVKLQYPWCKDYLDVYACYNLATDKSIFGHCLHLTDAEWRSMAESGAIISWCPISNDFLGSGMFNLEHALRYTSNITLASDWGAGTSLSMFSVLDSAYKTCMQCNYKLPSMLRWYMATLGAARALQLQDHIGNFAIGKEADFIVIDPNRKPILHYRSQQVSDIFELLFILMTLADERNILATYVYGECLHHQD